LHQLTAVEPKERGLRLAGIRVGLPRRSAAAASALIVGVTAGALLFSAPAQAHNFGVTAKSECVSGKWKVEWTFANDYAKIATLSSVKFTPAADGVTPPSSIPANGTAKVTVSVDGAATTAQVTGTATWPDNYTKELSGSVTFKGTCVAATPTPTPTTAVPVPTTPPAPTPTRVVPAGPQLPVTGDRSWILAVGGIVVLAAGIAVVILVPRRRLRNRRA
jgi:hypothetical protein